MVFRSLKPKEAEAFWNMMNSLDYETEFMMYEPGERTKNLSRIESLIEDSLHGGDFLLVAEENQELAGYISAQRGGLKRIQHTANVVTGVRQKYRRRGIGTKFFEELDEWARENQVTRMELTVLCPNIIALRLYEKNGFVIEGIKRNSMLLHGELVDEYYMGKIK